MLKFIRLHIYFLKKGKQDAYMYTMSAILMADSRLSYKWSTQVQQCSTPRVIVMLY